MKAVVQRVSSAQVTVEGRVVGAIEAGLVVLLGVAHGDTSAEAQRLAEKICHLRIFADEQDKMNLSLLDTGGAMLVVSQFTLLGDCRKGRRPSFVAAAEPEIAKSLYEEFVEYCQQQGIATATGTFRAMMDVSLVNEGPVTMLLDTAEW